MDKKPVVNAQSTEAAREKQERIKERFKEWIWSDDERRERLVRLYNDTFNHSRVRTFNGEHLTLPGASADVQLHLHQKAGVWRILQTPNTLLGHVVGAGKTYTMVAAAMELKRLGLARKPMFAVPNHMLGQFSTELLMLYPGANILVAGKEDFESQNRKKLFSRIATGNWDAVIVTHSGFERIPLSCETQECFFKEQLEELEKIKRENANPDNRRLVKELEKAKKRLEAKLEALAATHKKDNTMTFEELGIDRLFVDEAHYFKNLFYISKMTRIAGLPQTASERAFDMYLKVRHIQSANNGGGVVFATGTPIANLREDLTDRQDTGGDKFRIELDKQVLDNRGVAGELMLRWAEKIKMRFGEDIRIGRFAGFDLFIRSGFNNTAEVVLRGKNSYSTRITDTALGTIRSLESVVQGFEERATRLEADIKDSQKRATELESKVGSPFEKEERYHHLARRQSEIEEQLDLTKNQAPSQVDAATTDEREDNSEKQTETKSIQPTRRAAVRV